MVQPDRSVLPSWMVALLASLAMLAGGCQQLPEDIFKRVDDDDTPADDDDTTPTDDDDDSTEDPGQPPVLTLVDPDPSADPPAFLTGTVPFTFELDDPDSTSITVTVNFTPLDGAPTPATLLGADPVANQIEYETTPFFSGFTGGVDWDTVADVPASAAGVQVEFCPVDAEGNAGECETWPNDVGVDVINAPPTTTGAFCQPGDLEEVEFDAGETLITLSDGECLNYQLTQPESTPDDFSAQFLLVFVNPNSDAVNFEITWADDPDNLDTGPDPVDDDDAADDDDSAADDDDSAAPELRGGPLSHKSFKHDAFGNRAWTPAVHRGPSFGPRASSLGDDLPDVKVPFSSTCAENLDQNDVHQDEQTFFFRSDLEVESERSATDATLRALGDTVSIYVDNETPLDIDRDCDDPDNEIEIDPNFAEGFTSCHLEAMVDVVDNNLVPTLTSVFGDLPDVDNNCRVTIFLSSRMNRLTLDTDASNRVIKSLAEPDIDLWQADNDLNPGSNEEEVLYVYAPDPLGLANQDAPVALADYLNYDLAGQIAFQMQKMISYAAHRGVGKFLLEPDNPIDVARDPAEEDWLDDGMGLLAADLTGFGAIAHPDAWIYLDRTHIQSPLDNNTLIDFQDLGDNYLLVRYIYDLLGPASVWDILHAGETNEVGDVITTQGLDSLTAVLGVEEFSEFALQWALAMAVSNRTNILGGPLVLEADVPPYDVPTAVSVPNPDVPVPGELYGANGFQQGFQIRGINHTFTDGSNPAGPTELPGLRVRTENIDPLVFHQGEDNFGTVAAAYGVTTVIVSGLNHEMNWLLVETDGADLVGAVVRLNDYHPVDPGPPISLENVLGPVPTTLRQLGPLDPSGRERRVIGRIDAPTVVDVTLTCDPPDEEEGDDDDSAAADDDDSAVPIVYDPDEECPQQFGGDDDDSASGTEVTEVEVSDTDRFGFSLGGVQHVGIWIDRRYSDVNGGADLSDPFLAVVPASDVPDAFNYSQWGFGWQPAHGTCSNINVFQFPQRMPVWVGAQANLLSVPEYAGPFDALVAGDGAEPGSLPCVYDRDLDGVPDSEESEPLTLTDQIQMRQAENLLLDPNFYGATFGALPGFEGPVTEPFFDARFVDVDSNEDPADDLATAFLNYNIGGRALAEGEEAVWQGVLPGGDYVIIVGDASGATGTYDLSVRVIPPAP